MGGGAQSAAGWAVPIAAAEAAAPGSDRKSRYGQLPPRLHKAVHASSECDGLIPHSSLYAHVRGAEGDLPSAWESGPEDSEAECRTVPRATPGFSQAFQRAFKRGPQTFVWLSSTVPLHHAVPMYVCVCVYVLFEYMAGSVRAFLGDGCLLAPTVLGGNHRYGMMPVPGQARAHVRCMRSGVNE